MSYFAGTSEANVICVDDTMLGEDFIHQIFLRGSHVSDDEICVGRDDLGQMQLRRDLGKSATILRATDHIDNASHADVNAAVEVAISLFVPAQSVFDGVKVQGLGREGFDAR